MALLWPQIFTSLKTQAANIAPLPQDLLGAVKEQASGLYAQTMAKRGFLPHNALKKYAGCLPSTTSIISRTEGFIALMARQRTSTPPISLGTGVARSYVRTK
jgi:hypothetical protein